MGESLDRLSDRFGDQFGNYRCPVCGHRDMALVEPDVAVTTVPCRYCETPLILRRHGWAPTHLTVQVATPPPAG